MAEQSYIEQIEALEAQIAELRQNQEELRRKEVAEGRCPHEHAIDATNLWDLDAGVNRYICADCGYDWTVRLANRG